jgi:hypothetical protein
MTDLELKFKELNIDYSKIGFYDSPEFKAVENSDPTFLEFYAQYVLEKQYSNEYFNKAEIEIPFITKILNEELKKDGRLGACFDMSLALCRILEKEGYWNFVVKGSLTIEFPNNFKLTPLHIRAIDFGNFQSGHTWIIAPPFTIVDSSLRQQSFKEGEENYIPDIICSKSKTTASIQIFDIISPKFSRYLEKYGIKKNKLEYCKPDFNRFIKTFKPIKYLNDNGLIFKYFPTGITLPAEPLENVKSLNLNGKYSLAIYNEIILPKLVELRKARS